MLISLIVGLAQSLHYPIQAVSVQAESIDTFKNYQMFKKNHQTNLHDEIIVFKSTFKTKKNKDVFLQFTVVFKTYLKLNNLVYFV